MANPVYAIYHLTRSCATSTQDFSSLLHLIKWLLAFLGEAVGAIVLGADVGVQISARLTYLIPQFLQRAALLLLRHRDWSYPDGRSLLSTSPFLRFSRV